MMAGSPVSSFTPLATKIWVAFELIEGSSQATQGTGGLAGSPEPEKINGWEAARFVWRFKLASPPPRSWPACCHNPVSLVKRLAKICGTSLNPGLGSTQAAHGIDLPSPARVIVGK